MGIACDFCDKIFAYKSALMAHRRSHTGERRPFHCQYCPKSFGYKVDLNRHIRTHMCLPAKKPVSRGRKRKHAQYEYEQQCEARAHMLPRNSSDGNSHIVTRAVTKASRSSEGSSDSSGSRRSSNSSQDAWNEPTNAHPYQANEGKSAGSACIKPTPVRALPVQLCPVPVSFQYQWQLVQGYYGIMWNQTQQQPQQAFQYGATLAQQHWQYMQQAMMQPMDVYMQPQQHINANATHVSSATGYHPAAPWRGQHWC